VRPPVMNGIQILLLHAYNIESMLNVLKSFNLLVIESYTNTGNVKCFSMLYVRTAKAKT
jgi:hypothetical protein